MGRESLGPVQVYDVTPLAVNDALRELSERLDELKGLRGRAAIYDRVAVGAPAEASDAARLGSFPDAGTLVTTGAVQTITGVKTFTATLMVTGANLVIQGGVWRMLDANGTLIHAFGAAT